MPPVPLLRPREVVRAFELARTVILGGGVFAAFWLIGAVGVRC